jgi:hypothetical protein
MGQFPGSMLGNSFTSGAVTHRWVDIRAPEVRWIMLQVRLLAGHTHTFFYEWGCW